MNIREDSILTYRITKMAGAESAVVLNEAGSSQYRSNKRTFAVLLFCSTSARRSLDARPRLRLPGCVWGATRAEHTRESERKESHPSHARRPH